MSVHKLKQSENNYVDEITFRLKMLNGLHGEHLVLFILNRIMNNQPVVFEPGKIKVEVRNLSSLREMYDFKDVTQEYLILTRHLDNIFKSYTLKDLKAAYNQIYETN